MKAAFCPECEGEFRIGPVLKVGQRVNCSHCDAELEVINLAPLELGWAYDEPAADWEDEDETWDDKSEWEDDEDWEDEEEEEEEWGDDEDEDL